MTDTKANSPETDQEITEKKKVIASNFIEVLKREGFTPDIDDDGDIYFKFEGGTYIILLDEDDENYIRICFPGFYKIDRNKPALLLDAIDKTQKTVKLVKILLSAEYAWAVIEAFIPNKEFLGQRLARYLSILQAGGRVFVENAKESENSAK